MVRRADVHVMGNFQDSNLNTITQKLDKEGINPFPAKSEMLAENDLQRYGQTRRLLKLQMTIYTTILSRAL